MRVIQVAEDGALELSWMWLPTFIGQNHLAQRQLGDAWRRHFPNGIVYSEEGLDEVNEFTIDWLLKKFNITGLEQYLRAIKHVGQENGQVPVQHTAG